MNAIELVPEEMSTNLMQKLEDKKLIIRICPGKNEIPVSKGQTLCHQLYEPVVGYGEHKIITVNVNSEKLDNFGTHPDCEEFLFIGSPERQPLYLLVCFLTGEDLCKAEKNKSFTKNDFVLLKVRYNDPEVSFFTMCAGVAHAEFIVDKGLAPAVFYVTESKNMVLNLIDLSGIYIKCKQV